MTEITITDQRRVCGSDSDVTKGKMSEDESKSLKTVIGELLHKSSVYAVSQLMSSSSLSRKILWFLVLLIGLVGCSYEVYHFLSLYFLYPVVITLEVENNWKLDFPAVTICNLNRISNQYHDCLMEDGPVENCREKMQFHPDYTELNNVSASSEDVNLTSHHDTWKHLDALKKYVPLITKRRQEFAANFIVNCLFNGDRCSTSNFTEISSISFGTCLVFNLRLNGSEKLQTPYIGPNSGLELTLNLNADSYAPITSSVGARVVIHDSDVEPVPEDYGLNISPGFETSFAIQQTSIFRLPQPYKDKCITYTGNNTFGRNRETSIFRLPQPYKDKCITYTGNNTFGRNRESCFRHCLETLNRRQCLESTSNGAEFVTDKLLNIENVHFLENITESFPIDSTFCSCPLPCKSTNYEMTISVAEWPSNYFFKEYLKAEFEKKIKAIQTAFEKHDVFDRNAAVNATDNLDDSVNKCSCQEPDIDSYRRMYSKLKVFYKTLDRTSYIQEPMFQDSELFSQLGGQLGLWLGVSLMALFECAENIYHLFRFCCNSKRKKSEKDYISQPGTINGTTKV